MVLLTVVTCSLLGICSSKPSIFFFFTKKDNRQHEWAPHEGGGISGNEGNIRGILRGTRGAPEGICTLLSEFKSILCWTFSPIRDRIFAKAGKDGGKR